MNIVMFTPAVERSAIGFSANLVSQCLVKQGVSLQIVRTERVEYFNETTHPFEGCNIIFWNNIKRVKEAIVAADMIVYHVGDHGYFHEGCLFWLNHVRGVVCLHDYYLGNLFYFAFCHNIPEALVILRGWYGRTAAEAFFKKEAGKDFVAKTVQVSPMTEWLCAKASGVIVHSQWGIKRVLGSCPGPVLLAHLPYSLSKVAQCTFLEHEKDAHTTFNILTMGYIHLNKRPKSVIEAISASNLLKKNAVYTLAGEISPDLRAELEGLAGDLGVKLNIMGRVDEKTLGRIIAQTDVVTCLRWPSLEAASATAISSMLCSKSTIVTDVGFYAEIPDHCVIKINPENEVDALKTALETLYLDPNKRESLGKAAHEWSTATFSSMDYATSLIKMVGLVNQAKPALSAVSFYTEMLREWGATNELFYLDETIQPLKIFEDS